MTVVVVQRSGSSRRCLAYLTQLKMLPFTASFKQGIVANGWSTGEAAAKIDPLDKKHKPRTPKQPAAAVPPLPQPVTTTVGMPISVPMPCLAFVAASPLPMQSLGYFPPRA